MFRRWFFIVVIGLCDKILEVCLKEVFLQHNVQCDSNVMVGTLIKPIREHVLEKYLDPTLERFQYHQRKSNYHSACERENSGAITRSSDHGDYCDARHDSSQFKQCETIWPTTLLRT